MGNADLCLVIDKICHDLVHFFSSSFFFVFKDERRGSCRASSFFSFSGLYPSPGTLPKIYPYCNAMYFPEAVLGATPTVAQFAKVSAAAKTVVEALKRTTASGLEQ